MVRPGVNIRRLRMVPILIALCALASPAPAQNAGAAVEACMSPAGSACAPFSVSVFVEGARVGGSTVGLEVGTDRLALSLSEAETFGPLGNVIFELDGELRSGPYARARLSARGVLASVAARAALVAYGAEPERFDPLAVADDSSPVLGGPVYGVELGGTFRLDRSVILDVAPAAYLTPEGAALDLGATLRLLRAIGDNELRAHLDAVTLPGARSGHLAAGASVLFPRGRAPDWSVGAWVGLAGGTVLPGLSFALAEDLGAGARVSVAGAYQPYRSDIRPLRGRVDLMVPLGGTTITLTGAGGALHATSRDALAARLSLSLPWPGAR